MDEYRSTRISRATRPVNGRDGSDFTQIAFLGHDSAHRQIFVSGKWKDWLSIVLGDLLVGMSYGWRQHKHTRHHANPNKLGADPDIDLPALFFIVLSPGIAFVFLAVQLGVFGIYMGASFAPNHKGIPVVPRDVRLDFLHRQAMMSRNIRGTRLLDTVMGGLNYQIEHHLFPSMPRPHLRKAAPIIAEYCRTHDVPYLQTGLFASYAIVVRYINRVWLGERDVFTCPLVEQRNHFTMPAAS